MEIPCVIYFAFFIAYGSSLPTNQEPDKTNRTSKTGVENRWNFYGAWDLSESASCITGFSDPGFCVPLLKCPELLKRVRHLNPGRIFENLQEYTYPCSIQAQVCCPDRRGWSNPPGREMPDQHHHEWEWATTTASDLPIWPSSNSQTESTRPTEVSAKPTSTPPSKWEVLKPKKPKVAGHKNRPLLPENECGVALGKRIVGGEETDLEDHPWMALLRMKLPRTGQSAFVCGGTLISERYVLTAAHCMKGTGIPAGAVVESIRIGEHNTATNVDCTIGKCLSNSVQDIPVEERIIHPEYTPNHPGTYNDIALLRLRRSAVLNLYVQPACLPFGDFSTASYEGKRLTTVGWGRTSSGSTKNSPVKRQVQVPIWPFEECSTSYLRGGIPLIDRQMCAGGEEGRDSCQGDSGGPLLSEEVVGQENRWYVQGVVSTGPKECGKFGMPALYTKVSKYLDWIMDNIKE